MVIFYYLKMVGEVLANRDGMGIEIPSATIGSRSGYRVEIVDDVRIWSKIPHPTLDLEVGYGFNAL